VTTRGPVAAIGRRDGDYDGRPTRRIESERLWVEVLATAGPRIVRLGLTGCEDNLLAETPDAGWDTPTGRYELFGGHRLWFAPEAASVAVPDSEGLVLEVEPGGVRLIGSAEPTTGLVRSIAVRLDPEAAAVELRHELRNTGDASIELSPWAITQLPLGGVVLLPERAAIEGHRVSPNRSVVLWPYTSWEDERLELHDGLIVVRADAGRRLKLGYFNEAGWVGYLRAGMLLVRRFQPVVGVRHADLGCNVETYCRDRFLELELLGPLVELAPGSTIVQTERWEVTRLEQDADGGYSAAGGSAADVRAALALLRSFGGPADGTSPLDRSPAPPPAAHRPISAPSGTAR